MMDTVPRRRSSSWFRGRSSIVVVNETRGTPFRWISFALALIGLVFGIRDIFFCDTPLSDDPVEVEMFKVFGDSKNNPWVHAGFHMTGLWSLSVGFVRAFAAFATDTAGFYHAMLYVVLNDIGLAFVLMEMQQAPISYVILTAIMISYQGYIAYTAHQAYKARVKGKETKTSEVAHEQVCNFPFKAVALAVALITLPLPIRDLFFCGKPIFGFEQGEGFALMNDCSTHDVKWAFSKNVAIAHISCIALRLFAVFGTTKVEEFEMAMMMNVLSSLGQFLGLLKVHANPLVTWSWLFLVGYDAHVFMEARAFSDDTADTPTSSPRTSIDGDLKKIDAMFAQKTK